MDNKAAQIWTKSIDAGKFRFHARMIPYDHGTRKFKYDDPRNSRWYIDEFDLYAG